MCSQILDLLGIHLPVAVFLHLLRTDDCCHLPQCAGKPLYLLVSCIQWASAAAEGEMQLQVFPADDMHLKAGVSECLLVCPTTG